jgi:membrane protease YdiL (CAAX protease family)
MHENATERAWWLFVSVLAGVGEEITWRGVQTALLVPLTGRYWIAAALSAASFGVAHALQGWRAAAIIVCFGLGFQAIVVASGSLYIAMAVHVAYDVTAGLAYGKLGRELGYVPDL